MGWFSKLVDGIVSVGTLGLYNPNFSGDDQQRRNLHHQTNQNLLDHEQSKELAQLQQNYNLESMAQSQEYYQINQQQSFDNNLKMWQLNNEYNTPLAQRQRLEQAGINPFIAMTGQGGSAAGGSAAPSPSTGAAPSPLGNSTPVVQRKAPQYDVMATVQSNNANIMQIGQVLSSFTSRKNTQDTNKTSIYNNASYIDALKKMNIITNDEYKTLYKQMLGLDVEGKSIQNDLANLEHTYNLNNYQNRLDMSMQQRIQIETNNQLLKVNLDMQRLKLDALPTEIAQTLALQKATILTEYARGNVLKHEASKLIQEMYLDIAKTQGQKISNYKAGQLAQDEINNYRTYGTFTPQRHAEGKIEGGLRTPAFNLGAGASYKGNVPLY